MLYLNLSIRQKEEGMIMRKSKAGIIVAVTGVFLITSQVFAGGLPRMATEEFIGVPPEATERVSNIARDRGDGKFFTAPVIDFLSRLIGLYIPPGDKTPGPGWGVPEGHNIGNAPQPQVIGKQLDRSSRGKLEPVVEFLKQIDEDLSKKTKSK